ncbi:LOW QUALITY PROTEIN: hypothetical protein BC936DRAFT_149895 [Jimgerdemannia flammicorona]|uniref:Uncharacterized protein n=1 Tax=Jimgerdemannia flammicorona TaxID=994334 RepID=A0A433CZW7_9FUNG|nr:LOW QUALITY PROTEIN: hypothetical protein BC936DRAFT_149895 [Jimgerdemannia flammicorona]
MQLKGQWIEARNGQLPEKVVFSASLAYLKPHRDIKWILTVPAIWSDAESRSCLKLPKWQVSALAAVGTGAGSGQPMVSSLGRFNLE